MILYLQCVVTDVEVKKGCRLAGYFNHTPTVMRTYVTYFVYSLTSPERVQICETTKFYTAMADILFCTAMADILFYTAMAEICCFIQQF